MERSITIGLIICLMQIFARVQAEGIYAVLAPGTIHSEAVYTAAVSVHHVDQPCQINIGITGPSFNETKLVEVANNEIKNVNFELPALEEGHYNLTAEGLNCMKGFKNTTELTYAPAFRIIRIQTDKGIYNPGDEINYRIVVLDQHLKPSQTTKNAIIYIKDSKDNNIMEIKDFQLKKGVYTGTFLISEINALGYWSLGIKDVIESSKVMFEVKQYVEPLFVMKLETPKTISLKDGDLPVIVTADYEHEKPLNGKVTVIYDPKPEYDEYDEYLGGQDASAVITKTASLVQGKAKFELNVKDHETFAKAANKEILITAIVEDDFHSVKINKSSLIKVHPNRYNIKCVHDISCWSFEGDKDSEILVKLTHVDGSHLNDTKTPVELTYTEDLIVDKYWRGEGPTETPPPLEEKRKYSFKAYMNNEGFALFKVNVPDLKVYKGYSHHYELVANYRDETNVLSSTLRRKDPNESSSRGIKKPEDMYLEDTYRQSLKLHKPHHFTVHSKEPMPYLDYTIIAGGNILKSSRIELNDKPKIYNLTLTPELIWAPHFALFVYFVDDKDQYHYAEEIYEVEYEFQNTIKIAAAAEKVKPGEEVALTIKTEPNSFVGLMAVDQNALMLHINNDFHERHFEWLLKSYATKAPRRLRRQPGFNIGCITLTNADYVLSLVQGEPRVPGIDMTFGYGGDGDDEIQVRKHFPETWIFDNIENTETAEFTWSKKIPDTITSWWITGFSVNSDKGIAVTNDKTVITTFKPFSISVHLPDSVKKDEVLVVEALAFNYLDQNLDVEVTLENDNDEFDFLDVDPQVILDKKFTRTIHVTADGTTSVSFMIRPKVLGSVMLKITAVSAVAGDTFTKLMKVI